MNTSIGGGPSFSLGLTGEIKPDVLDDTGGSSSGGPNGVNVAFPILDFSSIEEVLFDDEDLKGLYDSINLSNAPMKRGNYGNGASSSVGPSDEFLERDEEFQKLVDAGGNPSIGVDTWALNGLKKFCHHIGDQNGVDLVDMQPHIVVPLLCQFFEQVTKKNGKLYPTETLMGLLRAFNRVLRKAQEKRIMDTGLDEAAFNMKCSPMFRRVCVACSIAMKRSKDSGANLPRKKSKVVKLADEKATLDNEYLAKTYARGLQRYMIYDETKCTKTNRPGMKKFQAEHFREPLKTYEEDVVDMFQRYFARLPEGMENLFLKPIDNPTTAIWYAKSNIGETTLEGLINMTFVETGVHDVKLQAVGDSKLTNKSGRTSMVTRMGENGIPAEVRMLLTGHKSKGAYMRYDQSKDAKVRAAQRCINEEISYEVALVEEKVKMKRQVFGNDGGPSEEQENAISPPKKQKLEEPGSSGVKDSEVIKCEKVVGGKSEDGEGKSSTEEDYSWMDQYN